MEYRKVKDQIDKIIDISSSIFKIYLKIIIMEKTNNYKNYDMYINYMKIATQVEDNAYKELLSMCNTDDFYILFDYHIKHKNIPNISSIKERIENHIAFISYGNPTEEKTNDTEEGLDENSNKVIFAATNEFSYKLVSEFNNEITSTTDPKYREYLIKMKNNIIYSKKNLEYNLLSNRSSRIAEKKALLRSGQNPELIKEIYLLYINDNVNYHITSLIVQADDKTEIDDNISLVFLRTYLKSLTAKDKINIFASLKKFIENNTKYKLDIDNINKVTEAFLDTLNLSSNNKVNKKTNNC